MLAPLVIFIILLVVGLWMGELDRRQVAIICVIWGSVLAVVMIFALSPFVFVTFQAVLDCVLILVIFKENLQIR